MVTPSSTVQGSLIGAPRARIRETFFSRYGLILGGVALLVIDFLPTPEGLPVAGQRMIAILVFSVIIWISESISYPASAAVILTLMAFSLGVSPNVANPSKPYGSSEGLSIALGGFANTAVALVGGALFIAAAMMLTGLDRRIALFVLSRIGAKTSRVLAGVIVVGFILSFFVPSTTARVSCIVPIVMGIIVAFGVNLRSKFAGAMMIGTAQAASLWNVGIKTASAQNMIAVGHVQKMLGKAITWPEWFVAAAPFAAIFGAAFLIDEAPSRLDLAELGKTFRGLLSTFVQREFWIIGLFLFLYYLNPGFGLPLYYYMTDTLKFSQDYIGVLGAINSAGWVVGAVLYKKLRGRTTSKGLLNFSILIGTATTAAFLLLAGETSAAIINFASGTAGMVAFVATLALAADYCPKRAEGFAFALLMSLLNLSSAFSNNIGAFLYEHTFHNRLSPLILVSAASTAVIFLLVPLLRLGDKRTGAPARSDNRGD